MNQLVKICGFKNITDYDTKLHQSSLTNPILNKINDLMPKFKEIFPLKKFNLSRNNYKIDTQILGITFLKNCLNHVNINYDILRIRNISYLRLKPINFTLINYIKNMSNTFRMKQ